MSCLFNNKLPEQRDCLLLPVGMALIHQRGLLDDTLIQLYTVAKVK